MLVLDVCLLLMVAFVTVKGDEMRDDIVAAVVEDATQEDVEINPQQEVQEHHNPEDESDDKHLLNHLAAVVDLDGEGIKHIQEHLGEEAYKTEQSSQDIQAIKNGDDTKGIFYFFELHDFDKNEKLDGLELYHTLTDHTSDKYLSDAEAESLIDDILQKHDLNDDGYVSYVELMNSDPDSFWNQLGSNSKGSDGDNQDQAEHKGIQEDQQS